MPLIDAACTKDCEISMLLRPNTRYLSECEIVYSNEDKTYWNYLESEGAWLFSSPKDKILRIICPGKPSNKTTIKGVGIVRLTPGCQAQTDEITLITENFKDTKTTYIYKPQINLDISELYPDIKENIPHFSALTTDNKHIGWSTKKSTLTEITKQLNQIKQHKMDNYTTYGIIISSILANILIIGSITLIIWKRVHKSIIFSPVPFNRTRKQKCHPNKKQNDEDPNEETSFTIFTEQSPPPTSTHITNTNKTISQYPLKQNAETN